MVQQQAPGLRVLVIGAAGMIGRKLAAAFAARGSVGSSPIAHMTLADVVAPPVPEDGVVDAIETAAVDIADPASAAGLVAPRPDVICHLAAVVSGEAEEDFDKGYLVNLDATRWLFDAIRAASADGSGYRPRVVYASTLAVFGGPFPDRIGDEFLTAPATSYGTQKAIGELLVNDYSRRGFMDGISLRLPTICVRPGAPNKAASGFFSNIMREPLVGEPAVLPVSDTVRHWVASPRSAVGFFEHAAALDTSRLGVRRALNMPGLSITVAEQIEALREVAGPGAVELIRRERDPLVEEIVSGWSEDFDPRRAEQLGFEADASFEDVLRVHIDEELGGRLEAWEGR